MQPTHRVRPFVLAFLSSAALVACGGSEPTPPAAANDHGHDHASGTADHDHDHEHGDEHAGEPVVLHDAAAGVYEKVHVTWYRPATTPVVELVFEIELAGPSGAGSTVRGHIRSASGATSLTTRAEAEGEPGAFHLHCGELPADLGQADVLVLEFEPQGAPQQKLELPLTGA